MRSKSRRAKTLAQADLVLTRYAEQVRAAAKRTIKDIIKIGELLTKAKRRVGHGGWLQWIEREFQWSADTAENFVSLFRFSRTARFRNARDLPAPSALFVLARGSTPEAVRDAIMVRVEAGEKVTAREIKLDIAKHHAVEEVETAEYHSRRRRIDGPSPEDYLAMRRRQYFREMIERMLSFREHGVLDHPEMAADVLRSLDRRDGLERVREALDLIKGALPKSVVLAFTRPPESPEPPKPAA